MRMRSWKPFYMAMRLDKIEAYVAYMRREEAKKVKIENGKMVQKPFANLKVA